MPCSDLTAIILAGVVVFTTFTIESISGFGSTVLALPFIAMLIGIDKAVPFLSALSLLLTTFIIIKSWRYVDLREYGFIILHVIMTVPLGMFLMDRLPKGILLAILTLFMLYVGISGLRQTLKSNAATAPGCQNCKTFVMRLILLTGGIIQGAFSSGGPLIIIYSSKALPQKSLFRVTMSMVWFTTNITMQLKWLLSGKVWNSLLAAQVVCALPFIGAGMLLGDFLHNKVNEKNFRIIVYVILLTSAVILGTNTLLNHLKGSI